MAALSELEARVREWVDDLEGSMGAFPTRMQPGFDLQCAGPEVALVLTTDNGGGPTTSHPIAHTFVLRAGPEGFRCSELGEATHHHPNVDEALRWLRASVQPHLPDEGDFFLG